MAIVPITSDNLEKFKLQTNPKRTLVSSSNGLTGSVAVFGRISFNFQWDNQDMISIFAKVVSSIPVRADFFYFAQTVAFCFQTMARVIWIYRNEAFLKQHALSLGCRKLVLAGSSSVSILLMRYEICWAYQLGQRVQWSRCQIHENDISAWRLWNMA